MARKPLFAMPRRSRPAGYGACIFVDSIRIPAIDRVEPFIALNSSTSAVRSSAAGVASRSDKGLHEISLRNTVNRDPHIDLDQTANGWQLLFDECFDCLIVGLRAPASAFGSCGDEVQGRQLRSIQDEGNFTNDKVLGLI